MLEVLLSLLLAGISVESLSVETTFTLPPRSSLLLSRDAIKLPPQIPCLIPPQEIGKIPDKERRDLNQRLFSLKSSPLLAKRISRTPSGNLLVSDSSGLRTYGPPFFREVKDDPLTRELEGMESFYGFDFSPGDDLYLIGTEDGRLFIKERGKDPVVLKGFKGGVSPLSLGKRNFVADSSGIFVLKKGFGGWKKKLLRKGGFFLVRDARMEQILALSDAGVLRRFLPESKDLLGEEVSTLPKGAKSPLLIDANHDGREDIAFILEGRCLFFPGLGEGEFLIPDTTYHVIFSERFPFSPSLDFLEDGTLLIATSSGQVFSLKIRRDSGFLLIRKLLLRLEINEEGDPFPVLRVIDYNKDGAQDLLCGTRGGTIYVFLGPDFMEKEEIPFQHRYSAPTLFEGELIAGTIDGRVYPVEGGNPLELPVLDSGSVFPYAGDLNGDGREDLLLGTQNGKVLLFLKRDEGWLLDSSFQIDVGEVAIPALFDFDGDGDKDLFVTNAYGKIFYFEQERPQGRAQFLEKFSWRFEGERRDSLFSSYYERSYLPISGFEFRVLKDSTSYEAYVDLLRRTPLALKDEVAFTIAHTPTEVLRAMAYLKEENILLENARDVMRADSIIQYAEVIDLEGGLSTIVYEGKDTLPPELYYYYVVHPRILFEIPLRVRADYWERDSSFYGISRDQWLTHEEDIYRGKEGGLFWRTFFLKDSTYGRNPLDLVKDLKTPMDAVRALYTFQGPTAGGFMDFGYRTQDIQPLLIYRKAYGSCGEQSILCAAFLRTLLIPTYIAIDPGEDHQWNEFWGEGSWHHLDINFKPDNGIGHPETSVMKKPITAVIGWRPDDVPFAITGRYTDTARISLRVVDRKGKPLDGAMLILRSHWRDRNSVGFWTYTGEGGIAEFGVGSQPKGYTLEILSPFGATGAENIFFEEGKDYLVAYEVPGESAETIEDRGPSLDQESWVTVSRVSTYFLGRNRITSIPYRIRSETLKRIGYQGTRIERIPLGEGKVIQREGNSPEEIKIENRNLLAYQDITLSLKFTDTTKAPEIEVTLLDTVIASGEDLRISGKVWDNLGIAKAELLLMKEESVVRRIDITDSLIFAHGGGILKNRAEFRCLWRSGAFGPITPGTYTIRPHAVDASLNDGFGKESLLRVLPTKEYHDQLVFQDNPSDTAPSGSWIIHFFVDEPLRFLIFETYAPKARGLDLDIFLYRDKNQNGRPENRELLASSTSPTNHERIFVSLPERGEYWFYAQGSTVESPPQPFDLKTSFLIDEEGKARE